MPFQLESNYQPRGDQGQAIAKLLQIGRSRQSSPDAARRHRLGQDFHRGKCHPRARPADTDHFAQQDARRAALLGVQAILSPKRGRVFRQLLRLLSTGSLHPTLRHLHREGLVDQRRDRTACGLSATSALLSRRDTIVVASVSCIYGVTSPEDYLRMLLTVKRGQQISREAVLGRLVDMLYERNDMSFFARQIPGARRCGGGLSGHGG